MTETAADYIVNVLGGRRTFSGGTTPSVTAVRERIAAGLPYESFETVRERLRLTLPEAAAVLRLPLRTLARRRAARRLAADESDRLYRLARVAAYASSVIGSDEHVATWLHRPNRALNGDAPIQLLDTDIGARQVEDVLGRLEHGVPS